jgi:tRNA A-37 threonylcarbamoyl transferase component Bud32
MKSGFETKAGNEAGGREPAFVPPTTEQMAGLFPQLEIIELLGQGGMGAVYKARQPRLNRFVALKILSPEKQNNPQFAERFEREARALAWLNQPNIVTVYDFGETQGMFHLLMEFVDGLSLRQLLRQRRLAPGEALAIVIQICQALQYAHEQGIIHRDIKPENILLDKKGLVKIADFGIAKLMGQEPQNISLTGAADVVGTPHYMAPEQIEKPQTVDQRADIYSLGVVFYEMLTGELPLGNFQPPSQKVHIDVRLDEVVLHALEKEPERRYQEASAVKTAVETIANSAPPVPEAGRTAQEYSTNDYTLEIGSCLRRGWSLVWSDFWPIVGVTILILFLRTAGLATMVGFIASGPLMGGLCLYFLKKIRSEPAGVGTAFSGFSQAFLPLFLASLLTGVLTLFGLVCLLLPGIYLMVAWSFTLTLVIDKQLGFWEAMGLSRKMISKHWWKFFGFFIVLSLINTAGMMVFFVGSLITVPVTLAALMFAYEDIFGAQRMGAIPPITATVSPTRQSNHIIVGWSLAGLLILLLAIGLVVNNRRHALLNEINIIGANPSTNQTPARIATQPTNTTGGVTNFISEAPASPATTSGASASDLTIRSVEFGLGTHVADVTARVEDLLRHQPDGFVINAQSLGTDPKPGRGKVLTIDYDYQGQAYTLIIPGGQNVSFQTLLENHNPRSNPSITTMTGSDLVDSNGFENMLNSNQRLVLEFINLKFARFADDRTFEGWSPADRISLEKRMIDTLRGPQSDDYYPAINTLAALRSTNALPQLRRLVFEHKETIVKLEKSNRPRWLAIRALGVMGDKLAVPGMIHLLYHNNSYVRWSAQIALVRLTGQNFGNDWRAWGAWWSGQHRNLPFNPQVVRWWRGQAEPDELAKELAEGDQVFLDNIKGNESKENPPDKLIQSLSE